MKICPAGSEMFPFSSSCFLIIKNPCLTNNCKAANSIVIIFSTISRAYSSCNFLFTRYIGQL